MITRKTCAVLIFAFCIYGFTVMAEHVPTLKPKAGDWQQDSASIAVAMTFTTRTATGEPESFINIFIENTSGIDLNQVDASTDYGIQLYYTDGSKHEKPLRNYRPPAVPDEASMQIKLRNLLIKSGAIGTRSIAITKDEAAIVKAHPLGCRFTMLNVKTGQSFEIKYLSRPLTEEFELPVNK